MQLRIRKLLLVCLVAGFGLLQLAYIPPPGFVVKNMLEKRTAVTGAEIIQDAQWFDSKFPGGKISLKETLFLRKPSEFRVETQGEGINQVWVNQGVRSVIVTNGLITDEGRLNHSLLKDLFVWNEPGAVLGRLGAAGINTNKIGLGRDKNKLVYILGAKEGEMQTPQLWISKDSFRPVRLVVNEKIDGKLTRVEVRFSEFNRNLPDWYPGLTEIYFDSNLVFSEKTSKVRIRGDLGDSLFDPQEIKRKASADQSVTLKADISSLRVGETLEILKKHF